MILNLLRSFVWLMLILIIGLGVTFVIANAIVRSHLYNPKPLLVRDNVGVGVHTLSGVVYVLSTCDEVTVNTEQISKDSYAIIFTTWREPHIPSCSDQQSSREFHAVVFAPSLGVSFSAILNGAKVPIAVIPEIPITPSSSSTTR